MHYISNTQNVITVKRVHVNNNKSAVYLSIDVSNL